MEERKTIEIIDEHGINRKANIMCGIDVSGTDYVVYSIERDNDNDNLFVSKLIKNNDGTNNMINIDDNSEKTKLADIVKEMITQAVNTDSDKLIGDVTLSSGDKVQIVNVLINKEQKISVPKTYITTVKKSVTKVGNDFFKADVKPVVESIFEDAMPTTSVADAPEPVLPEVPSIPETPTIPEAPEVPEVKIPAELSVVEPVIPEVPAAPEPAVEPILPEETPAVESVPEVPSVPEAPPVASEPVIPVAPAVEPVPEVPSVPEAPPVAPEPVIPAAPAVEPVLPETSPVDSNGVFFDASAESNLNAALHEASDDSAIPVPNVSPIREFGVDTPVSNAPETSQDTGDNASPSTASGFANNKFFMVIAIVFFLASCVFLGYEVYNYITLVNK